MTGDKSGTHSAHSGYRLVVGVIDWLFALRREAASRNEGQDTTTLREALELLRGLCEERVAPDAGKKAPETGTPGAATTPQHEDEQLAGLRKLQLRSDPEADEMLAPEALRALLLDGVGEAERMVEEGRMGELDALLRGRIAAVVVNLYLLSKHNVWEEAAKGAYSSDGAWIASTEIHADLQAFMLDWLTALKETVDAGGSDEGLPDFARDFVRSRGVLDLLRKRRHTYRMLIDVVPGLAELIDEEGASS